MKKLLAKFLIILIILQIISPIGFIGQVFALSNTWDFSVVGDYIVSDSNKININNSQAKLKSTLSHVGRLNNGPVLLEQSTQVEISGNYAFVSSYGSNAIEVVDITDTTNPTHVTSISMSNTIKLYGAYALKISGNYLYVASYSDDDIEIIDISDPTNPTHVKNIPNSSSVKLNGPRDLDIVGDLLYVACYADHAVQIIDITDPTNPVSKGYLRDTTRLKSASGIKVSGNYAYVTSYNKDRLEVIDISDPDNLSFVGELLDNTGGSRLNGAWGIDVKGDYAYIASYYDDTLEIVDISDPTNPVHETHVRNTVAETELDGPRQVRIDGNFIYVSSFIDDAVQIIDISDPTNPVVKGNLKDTTRLNGSRGLYIKNNEAFITSSTDSSFQVLDISDKNSLSFKGELKGGPVKLGGATNIVVDGDYAYISAYLGKSMEVIDISDKSNPTHKGVVSDENSTFFQGIYDLQKVGNYIYAAVYSDDTMTVVDVSDPANPFQASVIKRSDNTSTNKLNGARGIYVEGDYAYVASYEDDALQIIDITDPLNPTIKGFIQDHTKLDGATDVKVKGNYAYVSSFKKDRVQVIDISDKDNPSFVKELSNSSSVELNGAWGVEIDGNYLYITSLVDDGVQIYDITDPANPVSVSQISNSAPVKLNGSRNSIISDGYLYVAAGYDDAVQIFDVSDKNNISPIIYKRDTYNYNYPAGITKVGNYIFIATYQRNSLEILKENYFADSPYVTPNNAYDYTGDIDSMSETLGIYNAGNVTYQISKDDGNTWYYYDGASWNSTTSGVVNSNTVTEINNNIAGFNALAGGTNKFKFKAFLNSNGNQKVELSEIVVEASDTTAPIISGSNISNDDILPGANHSITFDYSDEDGGSGINTNSGIIVLEKWDSSSSSWTDVSNLIGTGTLTQTGATYPLENLDFGKYKTTFNISDNAGNTNSNIERTFYIDKPELNISTGSVNIGTLNDTNNTFGDTLTVTVKTIGAGFKVKLKKNENLKLDSGEIIPYYDGSLGMGYDKNDDGNLSDYNDDIIMQEAENINTDGNLNTYTYVLKMGAIIDFQQSGGDYSGKIDFGIELDY